MAATEVIDLGINPLGCDTVSSVTEFDGELYCGTGRYYRPGSALGDGLKTPPGGKVFRVTPDAAGSIADIRNRGATPEESEVLDRPWSGKADDAFALTVYRGGLYCVKVITAATCSSTRAENNGRTWALTIASSA